MSTTNLPAIQSTEAVPLFPTFVWRALLRREAHEPLNRSIMSKLDELRPPELPPPVNGVWQTQQNLHELPEFAELVAFFRSAVESVLEFTKVIHEGFDITGCWANIATTNGWHRAHSHRNNYLSGVYYVRAPEGGNSIQFKDPRLQNNIVMPARTHYDETNSGDITMQIETGLLVLFPSWLVHSVGFNQSDQERISVSFDIMFSPYSECMSQPRFESNIPGNRP